MTTSDISVGVIGYGYWGPNLVRNFAETPGLKLAAVSDLRPERLALAKSRYPAITTTTDHNDLLKDPSITAIAIATPVSSHYGLVKLALAAGKHVWVEKPLTASSAEAAELVAEADRRGLILHVDHTFVYTGAVRKIRELVSSGEIGDVYYYDSIRVNLGLFQHDINVVWDLAVHDLSIIDYVLPVRPVAVSALGMSHIPGQTENIAFITLLFETQLIAHVNVNWLAPVKVRNTMVGGSRKMIIYDDVEPSEKIKIYDKGVVLGEGPEKVYQMMVNYRLGDMYSPRIDTGEALLVEAKHFAACIRNKTQSTTDGRAGLRVVRLLEAAQESVRSRGKLIEIKPS